MKQVYPTFIIESDDHMGHPFLVCVPDLDIYTEGESFADAIGMARDAIGINGITMEDEKMELPEPSTKEEAMAKVMQNAEDIDFSKGTLTFVDVDFTEYRRKLDTKAVRKNVSLPSWLNYEAEKADINVSRVLQDALMNVLGVKRNR